MQAWTDGPTVPPVDTSTTDAMPLVAGQRINAVVQTVMDCDFQSVLIHHPHQVAEVISVVRPAFFDVKLPLMNHFVGYCLEHF
jgi:hypothetical protein